MISYNWIKLHFWHIMFNFIFILILSFVYVIIMVTLRIHILMDVTYLTLNYKIINRNKQNQYKNKIKHEEPKRNFLKYK